MHYSYGILRARSFRCVSFWEDYHVDSVIYFFGSELMLVGSYHHKGMSLQPIDLVLRS